MSDETQVTGTESTEDETSVMSAEETEATGGEDEATAEDSGDGN